MARRLTAEVVTARPPNLVNLTNVNRFRMNGLLPNGWAMSEQCMGMLLVCNCLLNVCMAVPLRVTMVTLPYIWECRKRLAPTPYIMLLSLLEEEWHKVALISLLVGAI